MEEKAEVMWYIGTLDVPRPSSRVEIVAAMRRIRYEFKAKAIKKKKVVLTVSVDGVKVVLRKNKKKNQWNWDETRLTVMHHPIYRIFYVSHDSQDLKIWSYIARDGPSNIFKCNVFKAYKKSQAMRIVRTIGQAFEVCHKLSASPAPNSDQKEESSDRSSEENERRVTKNKDADINEEKELNTKAQLEEPEKISPPTELALKQQLLTSVGGTTISSPLGSPVMLGECNQENTQLPLSTHHQMQLLRQQLEQQQHQTQVAIAQVHLLKDQLSAETAARIEAQARAHQLLLHNKDLLDHVSQLVTRLQGLEMKVTGVSSSSDLIFYTPPQVPILPDPTTPRSAPVYMPDFRDMGDNSYLSAVTNNATYENTKASSLDADSPDSGHKEMSSDSLAYHAETNDWSHNMNGSSPTKHTSHHMNGGSPSRQNCGTPTKFNGGTPTRLNSGGTPTKLNGSLVKQAPRNPFENNFSPATNMMDRSASSAMMERNSASAMMERKERQDGDKVQIITPLPLQDASGNRLDLKIGSQAPRIDPPPRVQRSSRSIDRSERGSWYGGGGGGGGGGMSVAGGMPMSASVSDANPNYHSASFSPLAHAASGAVNSPSGCMHKGVNHPMTSSTDSDYYSTYASSNTSGGVTVTYRSNSHHMNGGGGHPHPHHHHHNALMRYSDSSARSSVYSNEGNRDSMASLNALRQKLDLKVNDLNSNQSQHPHHSSGRWKMRISYTSDDNSDNSDDMNTTPTKGTSQKIPLSALEEFDTLRT